LFETISMFRRRVICAVNPTSKELCIAATTPLELAGSPAPASLLASAVPCKNWLHPAVDDVTAYLVRLELPGKSCRARTEI
jgi:hypothetical protein